MAVLPFTQKMKVLELGGGDNPVNPGHWVNLDSRQGPQVNIVADLNSPLPIGDESFDGVFSRYLLEHISWRKIKQLIAENHRILKPGGICFHITANLLEQCRWLVNSPVWTDQHISCIFGDQNYEGREWDSNAHHAGFSPEYAIRLFKEAGFYEVNIIPIQTAVGATDLVIEARKSKAVVK